MPGVRLSSTFTGVLQSRALQPPTAGAASSRTDRTYRRKFTYAPNRLIYGLKFLTDIGCSKLKSIVLTCGACQRTSFANMPATPGFGDPSHFATLKSGPTSSYLIGVPTEALDGRAMSLWALRVRMMEAVWCGVRPPCSTALTCLTSSRKHDNRSSHLQLRLGHSIS